MINKEKPQFLCFECFDIKFHAIGKCLPQGTSTSKKGKCDSCNKTEFILTTARFNLNNLTEKYEISRFNRLLPKLFKDGNEWCVLLGEDIIEGIAGFGKSVNLAIQDWNYNLNEYNLTRQEVKK